MSDESKDQKTTLMTDDTSPWEDRDPVVVLYGAPKPGTPWRPPNIETDPLPPPEDMKGMCLEDAVIQDLIERLRALEARVLGLENQLKEREQNR